MLTADEARRLAGLLGMLADPVRSRILFALVAGELCVGDLALALDANEDQVSYALKMLRLAGLVSFRKDGPNHGAAQAYRDSLYLTRHAVSAASFRI